MSIIKFVLASPLQSWGEDAPWDERPTSFFPSKSAIIGLISSCYGYKRGDSRIAQLDQAIRIAVRADRPGILLDDFQTAQPLKVNYLVAANGGKKTFPKGVKVGTIVQHKYYLQDARFTVFLKGAENVVREIYYAMRNPVFLTYLGRKCCVPSIPLIPEYVKAPDLETAVISMTEEEVEKIQDENVWIELESDVPPANVFSRVRKKTRHDRVIDTNNRTFSYRNVFRYAIQVKRGGSVE